jgi:hypothetical protein
MTKRWAIALAIMGVGARGGQQDGKTGDPGAPDGAVSAKKLDGALADLRCSALAREPARA